jgi:hypothetical protein
MIRLKRRDQKPDAGERRRDHAEDQTAREPLSCGTDLLAQGVTVGQDATSPFDDALALGGQAAKSLAALGDQYIELGLQLANGGGQGGLRHTAGCSSATEMPFPRKRNQILEMAQNHGAPSVPSIDAVWIEPKENMPVGTACLFDKESRNYIRFLLPDAFNSVPRAAGTLQYRPRGSRPCPS